MRRGSEGESRDEGKCIGSPRHAPRMVPDTFSCSILFLCCYRIASLDTSHWWLYPSTPAEVRLTLGALYDALHPLTRTRNVLRCVVGASCKCRLGIHQMGDVARASCTGIEGEGAPTRARRRYFHCLVDTRLAIWPIPFYGIVHIQ